MKKLLAFMTGLSISISSMVNTCPITVINNTANPIQVHTNDDTKPEFMLPAGQQQLFGGHDKHAQFSLIDKNPNKRAESIVEISQHSCSAKPVVLHATDLLGLKVDETLFKVGTVKNGTN